MEYRNPKGQAVWVLREHSQDDRFSAKKLAELLQATEVTEGILTQRLRDLELARAHPAARAATSGAAVATPKPNHTDCNGSLDAGNQECEVSDVAAAPQIYGEF